MGLAKNTSEQYLFVLKSFLNFLHSFRTASLNDINKDLFLMFIRIKRNKDPYSETSIRQRIAALDIFFAWAIESRIVRLDNNPVLYYKKMKVQPKLLGEKKEAEQPLLEILSAQEQENLIKMGVRHDFLSIRNYCISLIIMTIGLHAEEIVTLNFDSVNLKKGYLVIGKGALNERKIMIVNQECKKACQEWESYREKFLGTKSQYTYFFNHRLSPISTKSLYEIISKYLLSCGIQKKHMGSDLLRQTALCNMIKEGYSIDEIKNITGIKTTSQIEKYKALAL